jgi:proteasome lid subunit RPN8/RPN11
MRRHAAETYPHECCGVLAGDMGQEGTKTVRAVLRCDNQRTDSPQNRYHIDPRDLLRIRREAAARGQEIVGFYHSHPDQPAHWSATDLAEAYWTGCSYVITSVAQGRVGETLAFELTGEEQDKRFAGEIIQIDANLAG